MKTKVTNTEAQAQQEPMSVLADAMIRGPSESIYAMEARGAQEVVKSDVLPAEGLTKSHYPNAEWQEQGWHEKCGIEIVGPFEGDDLFVEVKLPAGWKKQTTDHSMHTELIDEKGRKRAGIFYKAAFYDRKADIRPEKRFRATYGCNFDDCDDKRCWPVVKDGGKEIWRGDIVEPGPSPYNPNSGPRMQMEIANKRAKEWLDEKYPGWDDLFAYWD